MMASDQRPPGPTRQTGIQANNTQPGAYQSRIRSLLGMPITPVISKPVRVPALSPVAFEHQEEPLTAQAVPGDAQDPLVEAVSAAKPGAMPAESPAGEPPPGVQPQMAQTRRPVEGPQPKPPPVPDVKQDKAQAIVPAEAARPTRQTPVPKLNADPLPTRSPEPETQGSSHLADAKANPTPRAVTPIPRSPTPGPGVKQGPADTERAPTEEQPVEEINLVVPGLSEGKRVFPALAPDPVQDEVVAPERNQASQQPGRPATPAVSWPEATIHRPEGQKATRPTPRANDEFVYRVAAALEAATTPAQSGIGQSQAAGTEAVALARAQQPDANQPAPAPSPRTRGPAAAAHDAGKDMPSPAIAVPSERRVSAANVLNQVHSTRDIQVERLKKTVHELEAKVAAQAARLDQAARPQPLPSSSPPIVIVNRSAQAAGTPRAYWARSYLGRFRLRTLR